MSTLVNEFNDYRTRMNELILSKENLVIKRLWNLDTNTYAAGALDVKTKELLGLVASMGWGPLKFCCLCNGLCATALGQLY